MVITGRYDHVIDEKGRLAIPSQVRNAMNPDADGTAFFLVPEANYLQLIPEKLFDRLSSHQQVGLKPSEEVAQIRRVLFSTTFRLEPDKQGRVIVPDGCMADSKSPDPLIKVRLRREVTLVGASDRLELWNREDYIANVQGAVNNPASMQVTLQKMFGEFPLPAVGSDVNSGGSAARS